MDAKYEIFAVKMPGPEPFLRHVCQFDEKMAVEAYLWHLQQQNISLPSAERYKVMVHKLPMDNYSGYVVDISAPDANWQTYLVSTAGVCLGFDVPADHTDDYGFFRPAKSDFQGPSF